MLDIAETTTFEWGRISTGADWLAPLAVLALFLAYAGWMYRRDAAELGMVRGGGLALLRGGVFCLLVGIYLQPQWRHEQTLARNAKIHLLVDTSLSMGLADANGSESLGGKDAPTRSQRIARSLTSEDWLDRLRDRHDLVVSTFDRDIRGVASLNRHEFSLSDDTPAERETESESEADAAANEPAVDTVASSSPAGDIDWDAELTARGDQSRLGDAVAKLVAIGWLVARCGHRRDHRRCRKRRPGGRGCGPTGGRRGHPRVPHRRRAVRPRRHRPV